MTGHSPAVHRTPGTVRRVYEAYGATFALELFDVNLVERLEALLPSEARLTGMPDPEDEQAVYRLTSGDDGVFGVHQLDHQMLASRDLELALWMLSGIAREYVAFSAHTGIFIRGAAVAYQRRAIAIVGPALSGRTTLTEELIRCGATGWADEYVVFDTAGRVKRFGMRSSERAEVGSLFEPLPLGAVLLTSFRPGIRWAPSAGSGGDAVLAMLAQAIPARGRSAETMAVLRRAVTSAAVLVGDRGEASDAGPQILAAVSGMFGNEPLFS